MTLFKFTHNTLGPRGFLVYASSPEEATELLITTLTGEVEKVMETMNIHPMGRAAARTILLSMLNERHNWSSVTVDLKPGVIGF